MTFYYDSDLLAAVSAAPTSIGDVIRTMEAIDRLCSAVDGLKWFNALYLDVTRAVAQRTASQGFRDTAWLLRLDVCFAELYFGALRMALGGGRAAGCWRALLDRRKNAAIARIQFALAGVNAHINHDLPVAIGQACEGSGTSPLHGSTQYQDYTSVNSTLDSLVDSAKQQLMVRLPGDALPPVSHVEDAVASFSVCAAREAAWNNAEMLWALRPVPPVRDRALETLDGMTAFAGKALLAPVPIQ